MDNQPHTERPAYSTIPPRFEEMDALSADTVLNIAVAILVGWQVRTDPDFYFGIAALPPWWREDAALEAAGDPYRVWPPGDELEELPQEPADEDWLDLPVSVGGRVRPCGRSRPPNGSAWSLIPFNPCGKAPRSAAHLRVGAKTRKWPWYSRRSWRGATTLIWPTWSSMRCSGPTQSIRPHAPTERSEPPVGTSRKRGRRTPSPRWRRVGRIH
jgi:hypothetical protein